MCIRDSPLGEPSSPAKIPAASTSIQFEQFQIDHHSFDEDLVSRVDKIERIREELETASASTLTAKNELQLAREQVRRSFKQPVPHAYIDALFQDNLGQQRQDWYFITENAELEHRDPWDIFLGAPKPPKISLKDLLQSFGVSPEFMSPDFPGVKTDMYDTMNRIPPVALMSRQLQKYYKCRGFKRSFICFILDRNIFNSPECSSDWCSGIFERLNPQRFIRAYLRTIPRDCYMLHLRICRQIPEFSGLLCDTLFGNHIHETVTTEFKRLLDGEEYQNLLYFVLFVYGTGAIPFGETLTSQVLSDQIYDLCKEGNHVELVVIRSYINLFKKMR